MPYEICLTRLAAAVAKTRYTVDDLIKQVRKDLDGLTDPSKLLLHCVRMPGADQEEFICRPNRAGGVTVDTFSYEEAEVLTSGPFRGRRVLMPVPDSGEGE